MTHADPDRDLLPFAFGELEPERRREVDAHLRACESCRRELEALQALRVALPSALEPTASTLASARLRLQRNIGRHRRPLVLNARRRLVATAITLAASALLLLLLRPYVELTPPSIAPAVQRLEQNVISRFNLDFLPSRLLAKERPGA